MVSSSIFNFSLLKGTATVPISSPTNPAATLAITAAASKSPPQASTRAHTATTVSPAPVTSKTSRGSVGKCLGLQRGRNKLMPSAPRVISTPWARHWRSNFAPAASSVLSSRMSIAGRIRRFAFIGRDQRRGTITGEIFFFGIDHTDEFSVCQPERQAPTTVQRARLPCRSPRSPRRRNARRGRE